MDHAFADKLKVQSEEWQSNVKEYQARLAAMGDKAHEDYKKAVEQMQAKANEARALAEKVRNANEAAWNDTVTASQKAFIRCCLIVPRVRC